MLLKQLTELNGLSGNEAEVRDFIKNGIEKYSDSINIDSIGNLIAFKKGKSSTCRVMLSAHMDEVGLMAIGYTENGSIRFKQVGGIDERILPGKRVLAGDKRLPGVIGCKAIHLQERDARGNNLKMKNLYIDIGAEKKEDAEKLVKLGDYIAFNSDYLEFGEGCVKAKALDDRVGCAIIMEMLKNRYEFDLYACFTTQEEIGLRGSAVAAYTVKPDIALVIEGTTCSDVPGVEKHEHSTNLGEGAALTFIDRTSYPDRKLVDFLYNTAQKHGIKVQFKKTATGGNDAGKIQLSGSGVKVASISVPCRYIHSPVSVMSMSDYDSCLELVRTSLDELSSDKKTIENILNGGAADV